MAGRIAGLTIEIGGDTTKLQSSLKGVDSQLRAMRTSLRDVDRLLKIKPTSTELLTQKQQLLKNSIEQTKDRLTQLKEAQAQMDAKGIDENSDDYQRLQREIIATEEQLKNLENEYKQVASVAGVQLQEVGDKMQEVGSKISEVGESITKHVTVPLTVGAGAIVAAFTQVDKGMDTIVAKTGAAGDALADMKGMAKDLATEIPTDFQTAGAAVGEINTRFKLSGDELKDLSSQFIKFSKLNNTDVSTSIDSVQAAMAAFGLSSDKAGAYLDTLNKVGQNTGADVNRLSQDMLTNAASFKAMGYSASDAANFLGQLSVNGVDSSQVMVGLKKAFVTATKDGVTMKTKLKELQKTMENADSDTEAYAAAMEIFGNRAGPALATAIREGRLSLEALGTSLDDNVGNVNETFEKTLDPVDKFKMAVNQAKVAGADLGNALLTRVTPMIEKFQDWIGKLGEKFKALSPAQQDMIVKIGLVAAAIGPVVLIVGKLTSGIGLLISGLGKVVTSVAAVAAGMAPLATTIGVVVGAMAAVGVAAFAYAKANQKAIEEETKFNKEQQATFDTLTETTKAYKEATSARDTSVESVIGEFDQVEKLKDEYNNLVGANGKVKKGYKDRAEYIKGELAEALGLEKDQIDELIDKNGKLKGKIDDVIQTQKAQAVLEANKDVYIESLKNQKEAAEKLGPALVNLDDKKKQLSKAEQEYQALLADYNAQDSNTRATKAWTDQLATSKATVDALKQEVGSAQKAVDGYTTTISQSKAEIDRYDGLTKALADKDKKAVAQWVADYTQGLKSRNNATEKELKDQVKIEEKAYEAMRKARKEGDTRITDDIIKQQEKRVDYAKKEANAVTKEAAKEGSGVKKELQKSASGIKGIFPVNVGKAVKGSFSLPDITAKIASIGKGVAKALFPQFSSKVLTKYFAAGYENPKLFTSPTIYGGAMFGDKGTSRGGEIVYGKENLMRDIQTAVAGVGGVVINMTVNGVNDPRQIANDVIHELEVATRAM